MRGNQITCKQSKTKTQERFNHLHNPLVRYECPWGFFFFSFFFSFLFYIGVYPINNVVIVSGAQQSNSVHTHVSLLPQAPVPSRLPHNIEQSSLCYTAGPCWLPFLNIAVCTCQPQTPCLSLPSTLPSLVTISSFAKSVSPFLFCKYVHLYHFFLYSAYKWCMIFLFPCLSSLSMTISRSIHVAAKGIISSFFMAE